MEFVSALTRSGDQARGLEHFEVLRDALASHADIVLHGEACAQLKERLAVALDELVENSAPDRRHDRFEDVAHGLDNRQVMACLSRARKYGAGAAIAKT